MAPQLPEYLQWDRRGYSCVKQREPESSLRLRDNRYGIACIHTAKLFPQRGRLYLSGAVPGNATLQH